MLTCIACSKQLGGSLQHEPDDDDVAGTPSTRQAIKALTAQIKEMALKASGAYRHCKPCSGSAGEHHHHHHHHHHRYSSEPDAASGSERFHYSYRRAAACSGLGSSASTPRAMSKETESRLRAGALSSGDLTPSSVSGRTEGGGVVLPEEEEQQQMQKEWVAQVEPGVLITFVSIAQGGNDLKRIRFSREMFNKWQAQRWWAENCEKVMELYNVQRFNRQAVPLPTPPRSEDEISKMESAEDSPVTPPLSKERVPRNFHRPVPNVAGGVAASSSDSLDRRPLHHARHYCCDSGGLASTPKLSGISGAKTETSSMDASGRTSSSREGEEEEEDRSASVSNASDQEREWVEQDEPGVYITIRALPGGVRELRRVRFSRERFSEMHARLWWEENRARIHEQYL